MQLIVFDIDGTLTRTSRMDDACYVRAVADVFGFDGVNSDWSAYEHCTDVAILQELIRERLGRECDRGDIARLRERFVQLVQERQSKDPSMVTPMPGAAQALEYLTDSASHAAALATGGFEPSARFKLACTGLGRFSIPAAFAEDGPSRRRIVSAAIARAADWHEGASFSRIVSVGDGVWDVRTAAQMKLPFVGIAQGERAEQLRAVGAEAILPDLADHEQVRDAFSHAPVPRVSALR